MIRPADNGTLFVEPAHRDGFTEGAGIYLETDPRLPTIYAEVTVAGSNHEGIRDGDLVIFVPHAAEQVVYADGVTWALSERSVCGTYVFD